MGSYAPRASLKLQVFERFGNTQVGPVIKVAINGERPTPVAGGYAMGSELFGSNPGPLELGDAIAIVGRCDDCLDLMCGYADALVQREDRTVTWTVRDVWFAPEGEDLKDDWHMRSVARIAFDRAAHDVEVARARAACESLTNCT